MKVRTEKITGFALGIPISLTSIYLLMTCQIRPLFAHDFASIIVVERIETLEPKLQIISPKPLVHKIKAEPSPKFAPSERKIIIKNIKIPEIVSPLSETKIAVLPNIEINTNFTGDIASNNKQIYENNGKSESPNPKTAEVSNLKGELAIYCPVRTAPEYPRAAKELNEAGIVTVRVVIDKFGTIKQAKIDKSSGSSKLDRAAINAVTQWKCNPPSKDGLIDTAIAFQEFEFEL